MKKFFALAMVAAAALAGCTKDSDPKKATDFEGPTSIDVPYNTATGALTSADVATLFTANGVNASFDFKLDTEHPLSTATSTEEMGHDANGVETTKGAPQEFGVVFTYDAATRTIKSKPGVLLPDELKEYVSGEGAPAATATDMRIGRSLINPELIVTMNVAGGSPVEKRVKLMQSGKPAGYRGTPTITFVENPRLVAGPTADSKNLVVAQTGTDAALSFEQYYTVTPIDFDYAITRVVVRLQPDASDYLTVGGAANAIQGGEKEGSGTYVVAFWLDEGKKESETIEQYDARVLAAYNPVVAAGINRIYVNVAAGSKPATLLARTDAYNSSTGLPQMAFTKAGQKSAQMALMVQMGDGTFVAVNDTKVTNPEPLGWGTLTWIAGEFSGNIKGGSAVDGDHAGWHPNIQPGTYTLGATGTCTITAKEHFMDPKYTATVTVKHEAPAVR